MSKGKRAEIVYRLSVKVPHYETRRVEVRFWASGEPGAPRITADGPKTSPHRYRDGTICVWEPTDPEELRWIFADGLFALILQIRVHLFKEAWWRETGEWLGPEVVHQGAKVA